MLAILAPIESLLAASATYKFVGSNLVINNGGCITKKDKITMTLVYPAPIPEGVSCSTSAPTSLTISDGVHKETIGQAYFNGATLSLCKLYHGNTVDTWVVSGLLITKKQTPAFVIDLENAGGQTADGVEDYLCSPVASGSTGKPGKWTGP